MKSAPKLRVVGRGGPLPAGPRAPNFGAVGLPAPAVGLPADATVANLIADYLASADFRQLAPNTQRQNELICRRLGAVFGAIRPADWDGQWGRHYLRAATAAVRANRDIAVLSVLFRRAVAAGLIGANPIRELKRNPERPRRRYVTDAELHDFLRHCDDALRSYVALKLTTGLRRGQLLRLRWSDWDGRELRAPAAKGGRETIYSGEGLPAAMQALERTWPPPNPDAPLVGISERAFRGRWERAMKRHLAAVAGADVAARAAARFTEHDLRAKVATDSVDIGTAQARLGHTSSAVTEAVYIRGPRRVAAARGLAAQLDLFG